MTEAMARYKCTIAAGHGGMVEIVDNGKNGFTFKPGTQRICAGAGEGAH